MSSFGKPLESFGSFLFAVHVGMVQEEGMRSLQTVMEFKTMGLLCRPFDARCDELLGAIAKGRRGDFSI